MGWLNTEKPPEKWSNAYFRQFIERLRTAINYLDVENFPEGLNGSILKSQTVSYDSLLGFSGIDIHYDFFALPTLNTVTSTTLTVLGSGVVWKPAYEQIADVYLEFTAGALNASYSCDVQVIGIEGVIAGSEQTITDTTLKRYEVKLSGLPKNTSTLLFKARTSNASYGLTIMSARIILRLK